MTYDDTDRRVGARLSRAPDVAGCVAIPSYSPADSESAGFLCIAAYVENSLFCRDPRLGLSQISWRTIVASPDGGQCPLTTDARPDLRQLKCDICQGPKQAVGA